MRASFIPGDLHLVEAKDGFHIVTLRGDEILRTRSHKAAAAKFNELRRQLESEFPAVEMTPEQKAELQPRFSALPAARPYCLTPNLRRNDIIGHQLVKAD